MHLKRNAPLSSNLLLTIQRLCHFRVGTFFLGGGGGAGEFWNFFPKKVLALPCVLIKKLLTPHL